LGKVLQKSEKKAQEKSKKSLLKFYFFIKNIKEGKSKMAKKKKGKK